jgi:hypothetical protein
MKLTNDERVMMRLAKLGHMGCRLVKKKPKPNDPA